jgi:hypothetical protein
MKNEFRFAPPSEHVVSHFYHFSNRRIFMKLLRVLLLGLFSALLALSLSGCGSDDDSSTDSGDNNAPVASAGQDAIVTVGNVATLNGSGSSDEDHDTLTYTWVFVTKPSGSTAVILNATSAAASFTPDKSGQYTIRLTVSDGTDTDTDDIVITAEGVAAPINITGEITTPMHLVNRFTDPLAVDYTLTGTVYVNAQLTIDPGVRIQAASGSFLNVDEGSIVAVGKADSMIVFTGSTSAAGHWIGIAIQSTDPANVLDYVEIGYGGKSSYADLYLYSTAKVQIKHSLFHHSATFGIDADNGAQLDSFTANVFQANTLGALSLTANQIGYLDAASTYAGGNTNEIINVEPVTVSTAQTWPRTDAPYKFKGQTYFTAAVTVAAGATFIFDSGAGMHINSTGSLKAIGTATSPIAFRGANATAGYWLGITFDSNDTNNVLKYVSISDGGKNDYANVYLYSDALITIDHVTMLRSASSGIYAEDGARMSTFTSNSFGLNTEYAIDIDASHLGMIDTLSDYAGDNTLEYIHVRGGNIESAQTWKNTNIPYYVTSRIDIHAAVTVQAGAVFYFGPNTQVYTDGEGSLNATGTAAAQIHFLGKVATQGYWIGIVFSSNNPANKLIYTEVANGGQNDYADVYLYADSRATITNSSIHDSASWGIYAANNALYTISDNTYANNADGDVSTEDTRP